MNDREALEFTLERPVRFQKPDRSEQKQFSGLVRARQSPAGPTWADPLDMQMPWSSFMQQRLPRPSISKE